MFSFLDWKWKNRLRFLSEAVTAIRCLKMFLTFINVKKWNFSLQPASLWIMNSFTDVLETAVRNNASVLIHIACKKHFIYKGVFFFFLVSRLQFTLKTSVSYLAQRKRFAYFINSQDKIRCADFALSTSWNIWYLKSSFF